MEPRDLQTEWATLLMRAFADAGVRDIVISPGGRIVPFVLALTADPRFRLHDVIDERAAAFYALGQARITGLPSVLLCTSGTAPAHYLPAIIEAKQSLTPLIVLSADRTSESQKCGAQQTIDQVRLFGAQVLDYFELGAADASAPALRATRRMVAQAVSLSRGPHPGPVHVNARARKPLEPASPRDAVEAGVSERVRAIGQTPMLAITIPTLAPSAEPLRALARRMAQEAHGVIALGPEPAGPPDEALSVGLTRLAQRTGYPILRTPISLGPKQGTPNVVAGAVSLLLSSPRARQQLAPKLIVQVGFELVSAAYEAFVGEMLDTRLEIISPSPEVDSLNRAAVVHYGDLRMSVDRLNAELDALGVDRSTSPWMKRWAGLEHVASRACADDVSRRAEGDEVAMVAAFSRAVATAPRVPPLVVGNSLPVREVSIASGWTELGALRCLHQRGASGIDGVCAGAAGTASVSGPTAVLVGDVTLLHDLHGLYVAGQSKAPLVIAVIANGGGKIFDQIAIGLRPDLAPAMPHFNTPVEPDFTSLARFCRGHHLRVDRVGDVATAVHASLERPGLTLLELRVGPATAAQFSHALATVVDTALTSSDALREGGAT